MPRVLNRMGLCSPSPLHRLNQTSQTSFFSGEITFHYGAFTVCVLNCGTRAASCLLMTWPAAEFNNRNMFKSLTRGGKMKRRQMVVCLCWVLLPVSLKQHGLCWVVISSFSFLSQNDSAETVLFIKQHSKTFPNEFEKRRNHAADLWRKQKTLCFALHSTFIQTKLNSIHRILQMKNQYL